MSSFDKDVQVAEKIERAWGDFVLNHYPVSEVEYSQGKVPGWDLKLRNYNGAAKFHEVKWDNSSAAPWVDHRENQREATGNLFIEYRNPRSGKPSGIMATCSDWWVYIVKEAYDLVELHEVHRYKAKAYIIKADQLKQFVSSGNLRSVPTVRDTRNGRVNAEGWLLPVHTLKSSDIVCYEEDFTTYIRALFSSTL